MPGPNAVDLYEASAFGRGLKRGTKRFCVLASPTHRPPVISTRGRMSFRHCLFYGQSIIACEESCWRGGRAAAVLDWKL